MVGANATHEETERLVQRMQRRGFVCSLTRVLFADWNDVRDAGCDATRTITPCVGSRRPRGRRLCAAIESGSTWNETLGTRRASSGRRPRLRIRRQGGTTVPLVAPCSLRRVPVVPYAPWATVSTARGSETVNLAPNLAEPLDDTAPPCSSTRWRTIPARGEAAVEPCRRSILCVNRSKTCGRRPARYPSRVATMTTMSRPRLGLYATCRPRGVNLIAFGAGSHTAFSSRSTTIGALRATSSGCFRRAAG